MKNGQRNDEASAKKMFWKVRLARLLFHGVAVVAALAVFVPLVLYGLTPPFPGKPVVVMLYLAACFERIWAMYLRPGLRCVRSEAGKDWSAAAVGYAYALTLGGAIAECLLWRHCPGAWPAAAGAAAYAIGVALRYWAFQALRRQWHVDVSDTSGPRHLVRQGPYRILRHPLYLGACLEIVGLPLFLGAWGALLFGVLVFNPLEVARAAYEERFLRTLFGPAYDAYTNEVWGLLPLPFRPWPHR
jgi:protein-S-isoprenylcysteine O-methyltransferase Ste14